MIKARQEQTQVLGQICLVVSVEKILEHLPKTEENFMIAAMFDIDTYFDLTEVDINTVNTIFVVFRTYVFYIYKSIECLWQCLVSID